jgi:hypothetical protein
MIRTAIRAVDALLRSFFDGWVKLTQSLYEPPTGRPEPEIILIPMEDLQAFVAALTKADGEPLDLTPGQQEMIKAFGDPRWN